MTRKEYLTKQLEKAILKKDRFSASFLITQLENLGFKVVLEYEESE